MLFIYKALNFCLFIDKYLCDHLIICTASILWFINIHLRSQYIIFVSYPWTMEVNSWKYNRFLFTWSVYYLHCSNIMFQQHTFNVSAYFLVYCPWSMEVNYWNNSFSWILENNLLQDFDRKKTVHHLFLSHCFMCQILVPYF